MLDLIHAKRATLVAQREKIVANLTAINGGIQCCDDLLASVPSPPAQIDVTSINDKEPRFVPKGPAMMPVTRFESCDSCPYIDCETFGCQRADVKPDVVA